MHTSRFSNCICILCNTDYVGQFRTAVVSQLYSFLSFLFVVLLIFMDNALVVLLLLVCCLVLF